MSRNPFALLGAILLLTGCSIYHVNSEDITTDFYPSKQFASDVVYLERVDKPHTVIGYVTVNTERRWTIDDVLDKMKREAAILGGDAITAIKTDASGIWKRLPAQEVIGNAYVRANFSCAVVVFK
jgi:hypothetical protein